MRWTRAFATLIAAVGLASLATAARGEAKQEEKQAERFALDENKEVGAALTHGNLTLYPVFAKDGGKTAKEYLVLDEGMDLGVVKITEQGEGSVNQLILDNRSDKPLFVMGGEVIIGGKQDRIIGKDTIIPPKDKVAVPVFCVEAGRWTGKTKEFTTAKALAHTKLRVKAGYHAQQDVWTEVAEKNVKQGKSNDTDTYRQVATDKSTDEAIKAYATYFDGALAKLADADKLVGFVVVLNGKIAGIEAFSAPKLFAKMRAKMLRSYYVEAVDAPKADKAVALPTAKEIAAFDAEADAAAEEVVVEQKGSKTVHKKAGKVKKSTVVDFDDDAAPPADVLESAYSD